MGAKGNLSDSKRPGRETDTHLASCLWSSRWATLEMEVSAFQTLPTVPIITTLGQSQGLDKPALVCKMNF